MRGPPVEGTLPADYSRRRLENRTGMDSREKTQKTQNKETNRPRGSAVWPSSFFALFVLFRGHFIQCPTHVDEPDTAALLAGSISTGFSVLDVAV
jgi:hypothetical protein